MSQSDPIGKAFGNYRLEARLGTGGMGQVYRARHLHLDWLAAVKVLHTHLAIDDSFRARFLQEARSVAMLEHPNIVRLFDFGEEDGQLYLVMELLTDGSLRSFLSDRGQPGSGWSLAGGLELVRQAAGGLAYAHGRGMVHRDIKPDNLLLQAAPDGEPRFIAKLSDFGLARLGDGGGMTATGVTLGTPAYMSPEQCQGNRVDGRSDIYSLGIVLYELVTGKLPFRMTSVSDAIYKHVYVAPPPPRLLLPSLSADLEAIILRCLAKHPEERFQSMSELSEHLDAATAALPAQPAASAAPPDGGQRFANDSPIATAIEAAPPNPTPPALALPPDAADAPSIAADTAGVQVPRVYVLNPTGEVIETADLTGDGLTVGRLPDNRLVLDVDGVSRHHLLIDWDGERAHVTDIGSSHGTALAGTAIPAYGARDWDPRDMVRVGALRLRLVVPAASAAERRVEPEAVIDTSRPRLAAQPAQRRRWPLFAAAGAAVVVFAVVAALLVTGRDNDNNGQATATSTNGIAVVSDATPTSAGEVATTAIPATPTLPSTPVTGPEWIAVTIADPAIGPLLGQPLTGPVAVRAPFQEFQRGVMISLENVLDGGGVLVAVESYQYSEEGNFTRYSTTGLDAVVVETPEPGPPDLFHPPAEPFAAIWQVVPGLRDDIGWANYAEPSDGMVYQRFERGLVVFLDRTSHTIVFYGELQLDSSSTWRAFWNEEFDDPDLATLLGIRQIERVAALDEVAGQLGAAMTDAVMVEIPYQPFEHGLMFTSDFLALDDPAAAGHVFTLVAEETPESGSWRSDHLVTVMLDPNITPFGTPPTDLYLPSYPFDVVLQRNPETASAIGWSTTSSLNSEAAWQLFERGFIIWFADTQRCWVIQVGDDDASGGWRSYPDE